jgi:hypothetical protein
LKDGEVGFMYFDVLGTKPRPGVVTVAYKKGLIGELMVGVAFCSPKEKHFSKKMGRVLATGRMGRVAQLSHDTMFTPAVIRPIVLVAIKDRSPAWMKKKGIRIEGHVSQGKIRFRRYPTVFEAMGLPKIKEGK